MRHVDTISFRSPPPRLPAPPHPTPASGSKVARPPIQNPYDKFTQPEFDAWIGGLTGALKHALGQVEQEEPKQAPEGGISLTYAPVDAMGDESEEDEAVEDSFAEITARRAIGKGKARDPREGPGFQGGNRFQPIEIVSSDEEDEEEVVLAIKEGSLSEDEESDEGDVSDHSDNGYSWERAQGPSEKPHSLRNASELPRERADDEEEYESGSQQGDYDDHGEEDYDDEYENPSSTQRNKNSPEIIEVFSDNDEDVDVTRARSARYIEEDVEEDYVEEDGSESEYSDEEVEHGTSQLIQGPLIHRPHLADDEGSVKGDDCDVVVGEEEQPSDEDTSFPPHISQDLSSGALHRTVEIRDPWSGPRMYAEDFYSGGDVRPGVVDPNHLSRDDDEEENQVDFEDVVQSSDKDISFPPQHHPSQTFVDIPNPWGGPQTYAEDFYSGGGVHAELEQKIEPSFSTGTADDGFDAFLTPRVVTALAEDQTCVDENELEEEGRQEDQDIYNDDEEDDQVIQPPQHHILSSRPPDIEVINVDDSEEEPEIEQPAPPNGNIDGVLTDVNFEEIPHICERSSVDGGAEAEENDQLMEDAEETVGDMTEPILPLDSSPPRDPDISLSDWPQDAIPYLEANNIQGAEEPQSNHIREAVANQTVDNAMDRASTSVEATATTLEQLVSACPVEDTDMGENGDPTVTNVPDDIPTTLTEATNLTSEVDIQKSGLTLEISDREEEFEALLAEVTKPECAGISTENEGECNVVLPTETFSTEPEKVVVMERALNGDAPPENYSIQAEPSVDREEIGTSSTQVATSEASQSFESQPKEILAIEGEAEEGAPLQGPSARAGTEVVDYSQTPGLDSQDQDLVGLAIPIRQRDDDGIRSTPGLDEDVTQPPPASPLTLDTQSQTQAYQPHIFDYEQLPTPPCEEVQFVSRSSVVQGQVAETDLPASKIHSVEIEEISDVDEIIFHPASEGLAEFELEMEVQETNDLEYVVPKAVAVDGAAGEFDADLEVISVRSTSVFDHQHANERYEYEVEEPSTEGHVSEEPVGQMASIGVASVYADEADEILDSERLDEEHVVSQPAEYSGDQMNSPAHRDSQVEFREFSPVAREVISSNGQPVAHNIGKEENDAQSPTLPEPVDTSVLQYIPMLATVNADDVLGPTSNPGTPLDQAASLPTILPGTPDRSLDPTSTPTTSGQSVPFSVPLPQTVLELKQQGVPATTRDGLFTPVELFGSASDPPNEETSAKLLTELAQAFFGPNLASSANIEEQWNILGTSFNDLPGLSQISDQSTQASAAAGPSTSSFADNKDTTIENDETSTSVLSTPNPPAPPTSHSSPLPMFMGVQLTKKSTDPVLFSDPYPASLSTPSTNVAYSVPGPFTDNVGSNELEDKDNTSVLDDMDELEFSYPAANTEPPNGLETQKAAGDQHYATPLQSSSNQMQTPISTLASDSQSAEDPFKVTGQTSLVSPDKIKVDDGLISAGRSEGSYPKSGYTNPAPVAESGPVRTQSTDTAPLTSPQAPMMVAQPTKRKRATSPNPVAKRPRGRPRKTSKPVRIQEIQNAENSPTITETIHVKPRGKANIHSTKREGSEKPSEGSRSSSASAARRLLSPSSRASSIASSAPSDKSSMIQQLSPTVDKPNNPLGPSPAPVSLLHAHGQKKNSGHPHFSQTVAQHNTHRKSQPIRVPSFSRPSEPSRRKEASPSTTSIASTSTTAVLSSSTSNAHSLPAPPSVPASRHTPTSNSPITRSHCRYHRISLPKEEGGSRVCFLVPGCSLSDRELMEDEEIEDHGDATYEDSLRMVKDIETLDFDLSLIGVIRQLVGLDILREQEVFYLPQPGEEIIRKSTLRRSFSERSGMARSHATDPTSPARSSSFYSPSIKAPLSAAGSTSTSHSVLRKIFDSERDSVYAVTDTEEESSDDDYGKDTASTQVKPLAGGEQSELGTMGPPTAQPLRKPKSRRSKLVDVTYEPDEEAHEESDEHDGSPRKRRKKASKRGTKRSRSERMAGDDGNDRQSKKLKAHPTTPNLLTPRKEEGLLNKT